MGKAKKKRPAKKAKKSAPSIPRGSLGFLLVAAALALYLGVVWFFITQSYDNQPVQTGLIASPQSFVGADYAHSLDLRVAGKATYPSAPIHVVKTLSNGDGLKEQIISFQVRADQLTEYALLYEPSTAMSQGGFPALILCHGYYNPDQYQTTSGYLDDMRFYASHGFAVIKPDYRGQGLSVKSGQPDGAFYSMSYNTDVMSLISAVKQTPSLDKNHISLWGHSMGAYIALRAAVLSPAVKNVVLLSAPVGTSQDLYSDYMAASDKDNPVALRLRESLLIKYGTPINDPGFWNAASPLSYVKKLQAHVQVYAGGEDKVVPSIFSQDLKAALEKAGKPVQYFFYPTGDHGLVDQRDSIWPDSLSLLTRKS